MEQNEIKGGGASEVIEVATSQLSEHSKQAEFSPKLVNKEWRRFLTQIATHGIPHPLVATKGFRVISGEYYLRAAKELGIEHLQVMIDDVPEEEVATRIINSKLGLPELSRNQKAALVILLHYEEERRKAKVREARTQFGNTGCPNLDSPEEKGSTNEILAEKAGIGKSNMAYLIAVHKARPDLFQLVFDGKYSINKAYTQMKKDEAPEVAEIQETSDTSEKLNKIAEDSETAASEVVVTDEDQESLSPTSILRNKVSNRLPQFTREFVHDFDLLTEADEETVTAYHKQIHSVAEGALLLLEAFETDAKKRLFFEFITKTFLLSKDEKKLNKFLETMGGILNEEE